MPEKPATGHRSGVSPAHPLEAAGPRPEGEPQLPRPAFTFVLPYGESFCAASGAISTVVHEQAKELVRREYPVLVVAQHSGDGDYQDVPAALLTWPAGRVKGFVRQQISRLADRFGLSGGSSNSGYLSLVAAALRDQPSSNVHGGVMGGGVMDGSVIVTANDPVGTLMLARTHPNAQVLLWLHNQIPVNTKYSLATLPANVLLIAVSESVRGWTIAEHSVHPDRIRVVPNGVDLTAFVPRRDARPADEPIRVIYHGRIDPSKGADLAARAVANLRTEGARVTLTIAGKVETWGIDQQVIDNYLTQLQTYLTLADGAMIGKIAHTQVPQMLAEHDIACQLPRTQEPFSLSALEAMAAGCAIVATKSGGLAALVGDAGSVVPIDDLAAVQSALRALVTDPARLASAKAAARARAEQFSWAAAVDTLIQVLDMPADVPTAQQARR